MTQELGGVEESLEHGGIVDRLQEAEMAGGIVMGLQVEAVDLGANAADRRGTPPGEPEACLAVVEERVAAAVEQLADLSPQRRHPVWVPRIDAVGQIHEMSEVASGADLGEADVGRHS